MKSLFSIIRNDTSLIILVIVIVLLLLFIMNIVSLMRLNKLKRTYKKFMNGISPAGMNIEETLIEHIKRVNQVMEQNSGIKESLKDLEVRTNLSYQKLGLIRFSAFENVGSDLSFSLAIMDDKDNGVVLTSIYSRESTTTFAKPLISGTSKYTLSAEELEAIEIAKKGYSERQTNLLKGKEENNKR